MKRFFMLIFILIVLSIHSLVNYYIFIRGWQGLELFPSVRFYYLGIFIFFFLAYIVARILESFGHSIVTEILNWSGSFWFAAMLYFFLIILLLDIVRASNHFIHFLPAGLFLNYAKTKFVILISASAFVVLLIVYGFINASIVRIKTLEMTVSKTVSKNKTLNIVLLSDIHLGTIIGPNKLTRIVNKINSLNPDIVLFAGDVVDENIKPVIKKNLGKLLENIKSKYGTYAITGNHEFIGGVGPAVDYLQKHKVKFLRDTAVLIDSTFWLMGRNDKDMPRFTGKKRMSLDSIMQQVDKSFPVIMMDHQPFHLEEAANHGVDIQFSGHTHDGQIFPLNYITRAIYHPDWGYRVIDKTQYYVSCGVGTWGPPLRIGNYPEIVNVKVTFK
jgi:uncharacterized protein